MKIFLHIGHGKCASSSIQQYFSNNHTQDGFAYGCLREDGSIEVGEGLKNKAKIEPTGYQNSIDFKKIDSKDWKLNLLKSIDVLSSEFDSLLMSNETWNWELDNEIFKFIVDSFYVEIIYIVRPPVQWINSAWWQWGNWGKEGLDSFVNKNLAKLWLENYNKMQSFGKIGKIHLLSLNSNIMEDVLNILRLKASYDKSKVTNGASSRELLSFMSMNRELRKGPHDSAKEFILNKYLKYRSRSDWVLSHENVQSILDLNKSSSLELSKYIENEDVLDNKFWWDVSAYKNEKMNRNVELTKAELNDLLLESYNIILSLDGELKRNPRISPSDIDLIRDVSLRVASSNLKQAYFLMRLANKYRPKGSFIIKKMKEFRSKLSLN